MTGFAAAILAILPRMTVEPAPGVDASLPSTTTFTVTNTGPVPLKDVRVLLGVCDIAFNSEPMPLPANDRCNGPLGSKLMPTKWSAKSMAVDEKYVVRLDDLFVVRRYAYASVSIIIQYNPPYLPFDGFRREKEFRFVTKKDPDGKLSWEPRPVEK